MKRKRVKLFANLLGGTGAVGLALLWPGSIQSAEASLTAEPSDSQLAQLGKALFYDKTLSNPTGMACVSCHAPETGYSYPSSAINYLLGTVPGTVKGRFGNRKPPSLAYAPFLQSGMPHYDKDAQAWVGGYFWDGRVPSASTQVQFPLLNPNEMNNLSPQMVALKVQNGPSGKLFKATYGDNVFSLPPRQIVSLVAKAIVAFEASPEVSPFTSKYDAYLEGKAELTSDELLGLRLATGTLDGRPDGKPFKKSAHCMDCHGASTDLTKEKDLWTNGCYANLGVPRNPLNPYYLMKGKDYVDPGLGGFIYNYYEISPEGDPLRIMSAFKAPSLRNVDKRPYPSFVKSYMHNGAFKSLKDVVHFYNTRNLTSVPGEIIDFTKPDPYADLKGKPVWDRPEYPFPSSLINPTGKSAARGTSALGQGGMVDLDAEQVGDLRLNEFQENAIVAFLKTLTDGYFQR